jgi:hypothetical protein
MGSAPLWTHGLLVYRDIEAIRRYLLTVTSALDRVRKEDEDAFHNLPDGISYEQMESLHEELSEKLDLHHNSFPTFVYQTTFASSYSFLEDELLGFARKFGESHGDTTEPESPGNTGIFAAKKRFEKHGLAFPAGHAWNEVVEYNPIRNAVLHCRGNLTHAKKATQIRAYADRNTKIRINRVGDFVVFKGDFCLEVLDNIETLIKDLLATIRAGF